MTHLSFVEFWQRSWLDKAIISSFTVGVKTTSFPACIKSMIASATISTCPWVLGVAFSSDSAKWTLMDTSVSTEPLIISTACRWIQRVITQCQSNGWKTKKQEKHSVSLESWVELEEEVLKGLILLLEEILPSQCNTSDLLYSMGFSSCWRGAENYTVNVHKRLFWRRSAKRSIILMMQRR